MPEKRRAFGNKQIPHSANKKADKFVLGEWALKIFLIVETLATILEGYIGIKFPGLLLESKYENKRLNQTAILISAGLSIIVSLLNRVSLFSYITAVSWKVLKKPVKSMVSRSGKVLTTPLLHHFWKSLEMT